jgi:hypothetical protein
MSGHRFGLPYCGVGWDVWRDNELRQKEMLSDGAKPHNLVCDNLSVTLTAPQIELECGTVRTAPHIPKLVLSATLAQMIPIELRFLKASLKLGGNTRSRSAVAAQQRVSQFLEICTYIACYIYLCVAAVSICFNITSPLTNILTSICQTSRRNTRSPPAKPARR